MCHILTALVILEEFYCGITRTNSDHAESVLEGVRSIGFLLGTHTGSGPMSCGTASELPMLMWSANSIRNNFTIYAANLFPSLNQAP